MKESHIHDAIGEISEDLLLPVEKLRQKKRQPWVKWTAMAACIALVLCLPLTWGNMEKSTADLVNDSLRAPAEMEEAKDEHAYGSMMDAVQQAAFRATVLEIYGDSAILVEPLKGEAEEHSSDRFEIYLGDLETVPVFQKGDVVEIVYDGLVQEVYPCRITGTISVKIVE